MTSILLKGIPQDISKFILKTQGELKTQRGVGKLHQSKAVLHIIKEYIKITGHEKDK